MKILLDKIRSARKFLHFGVDSDKKAPNVGEVRQAVLSLAEVLELLVKRTEQSEAAEPNNEAHDLVLNYVAACQITNRVQWDDPTFVQVCERKDAAYRAMQEYFRKHALTRNKVDAA
jgi:hypothetical protein